MKEVIYAMWLSELQGMTPYKCYTLFDFYRSFTKIFDASATELNHAIYHYSKAKNIGFISKNEYKKHKEKIFDYEIKYNNLPKGYEVLTPLDDRFPKKLLEIDDCPITLYIRSDRFNNNKFIIPEFAIGIVGARRCSLYGKDISRKLAKDLAKEGVNIVSGLAYGIDVAAHEGAMEAGGYTTAVLGGGVATCYPTKHNHIFNNIIKTGCVLSEEPFDKAVEPYMFPKRNRIISGLSYGILVVEAAKKSGSLITADFALEQGREVFAVPGRVLDPKSFGSNHLIKQGAKPVFDYDDILEEYVNIYRKTINKSCKIEKKLEEKEKIVYSCISYEPVHAEILNKLIFSEIAKCIGSADYASMYNKDELKILTTMNESDIILSLLTLELKGLIVKKSGCYYARSEV